MRAYSAAALFLLASIAGCAAPAPESPADAAVSANVRSALSMAGVSSGYPLRVHTTNGVVRLSGFARDDAQQYRAGAIASSTAGVTAVENHLVIMPDHGNPHSHQGDRR
jgi:osmotically-inducible protein OsmY